MKMYCIKTCNTCKKAKKWLEEHGISYEEVDVKVEAPSKEEFLSILEKSSLEPRRFLNTSGMLYREMNLKERVDRLSKEDVAALLAEYPMLMKRPLLRDGERTLVGFSEESYGALL